MANSILDRKGIVVTSGFKYIAKEPLDPRFVAANEEELQIVNTDSAKRVFASFVEELKQVDVIDKDALKQIFKNVQLNVGVKGKELFMPIRLKLTGVSHGIELINIVNILGKEEVINRLLK